MLLLLRQTQVPELQAICIQWFVASVSFLAGTYILVSLVTSLVRKEENE
jgi:hypothetical protein